MTKRIFAAVDISVEARGKIANYVENLRDEFQQIRVGWERAEKLHLTLKFFGDVEEIQQRNLTEAVENAAKKISNFNLQIIDTGVFPSKRKAGILWLGVRDETQSLTKLNEILETECEKVGFAREQRNFKAHLTIARLREPQKSRNLIERHLENDFESAEFPVLEIVVYESRLQKTGSIYQKISSFPFAGE